MMRAEELLSRVTEDEAGNIGRLMPIGFNHGREHNREYREYWEYMKTLGYTQLEARELYNLMK